MEQLLDGKEIVKSYGEGREKQLVLDHVSLEMEERRIRFRDGAFRVR